MFVYLSLVSALLSSDGGGIHAPHPCSEVAAYSSVGPIVEPVTLLSASAAPASVVVGATVTFTASASGGSGDFEYRFWLRDDNVGSWLLLQDYPGTQSVTWRPTAPGRYFVQVWARAAGSTDEWQAWMNTNTIMVTDPVVVPLAITSLAVSAPTVMTGQPVTWTATASGGSGGFEYRFWLRDDTVGSWLLLQDYPGTQSITWTPSAPGRFFVQVWARAAGSSDEWQAWMNSSTITVTFPVLVPLAITSLTVSEPTVTIGEHVTWTATASGGSGGFEYRFWLRDDTVGSWRLLQDYPGTQSVTWTPIAPGRYFVQVWVRDAGSSDEWKAWRNSDSVTVNGPPPIVVTSVTSSPVEPVVPGYAVTWSAGASGGSGSYEYKFWLCNETAGTWTTLAEYSPANAVTWTPTEAARYHVQVWVRDAGTDSAWDAWQNSAALRIGDGPSGPAWSVVRTVNGQHVVEWAAVTGADRYRVYLSSDRDALVGRLPSSTFVETTQLSVTIGAAPSVPSYYRVFAIGDGLIGFGAPVIVSTVFNTTMIAYPPIGTLGIPDITPALWDIDGDGCLDMVGMRGGCDGTFQPLDMEMAGLSGLAAPGRINRDSRFADFTGDGLVDIFTDVYDRADIPSSKATLHVGQPDGSFVEDAGVAALGIGGFGETVIAADFDNDGDVDLYLPNYTNMGDGGHSWLLINDGQGGFTDIAASAGVSTSEPFDIEGAQALDFNDDGWVDILAGSHLYINNGDLTFSDRAAEVGLPLRFEEGVSLVDVDLDGDLDLVHNDSIVTRLYRFTNGRFDGGTVVDGALGENFGYGLNVCDVNGDAFPDVIIPYNNVATATAQPHLLINVGGELRLSQAATPEAGSYIDLIACADLDDSGSPDLVARWWRDNGQFKGLINQARSEQVIRLRVVGTGGERNQQGRTVRITPEDGTGRTILRFVESGSGYMAQNGYDLLIAAPWAVGYDVAVRFQSDWFTVTAHAGDTLTIYADGRAEAGLR